MDRRSWPWKKKSSDKTVSATDINNTSLATSGDTKTDQDETKSVKYVQISVESYAHLTDLEDQVKTLNEKVSSLNDKFSSARSEMITKDNLVKQHAKVAEEAVSGWEKAEAEALALKQQLESVTLLKLTVEDRASHLDGALKECMKQVQNVKEESEQKLHAVVFAKTKQWEKAKAELEAKIVESEQELLRSSAEIAALSRTLQEWSNLLMKISDEKSQADAEIEVMKSDIQSCEREISSLKYELHLVSKELEIRHEEKNMSMRSAEVVNKQHLEDVKKITKLEAECQRLRGLVRKKLPGPAALAQMKIEVENLGQDYGENRLRRSPARTSSPHHILPSDFALENMQQCHKENKFLTSRLLAMEEEMKMLKEALSKRNSELQALRNMCAKTASKHRSLEAHFLLINQQKSPKSMAEIQVDIENKPSSLTSMSEDGIDEEGSCSGSWATALMSELSEFKREKNIEKNNKADKSKQLELLDDFLEMEKLARISPEANRSITISDGAMDNLKTHSIGVQKDGDDCDQLNPKTLETSNADQPVNESASNTDDSTLSKLQSSIASLFESQSRDADMGKLLDGIRCIVQDAHEELPQHSVNSVASEAHSVKDCCMQKECNEGTGEVTENEIILQQEADRTLVQELKDAISHIHDFVLSVGKEATKIQGRSSDDCGLTDRIATFSASVNKVLCNEESLHYFLLTLSQILSEKSIQNYTMPSDKGSEGETCISDCIDKVTLLENKVVSNAHAKEKFSGACMLDSHSSSDPEIVGPINLSHDLKSTSQKCSLEEFEQLKLQKENMEMDLAGCKEMLELKNHQFVEMEQHLSELKSQLAASKKSNSLAETQLKCMAEAYKSLESQKQELEIELNLLYTKAEMLEAVLQEEKNSHQDDLAKYKELQDQMERNSKCAVCSTPSDVNVDAKVKKEREIAAAAEKLAECQETIFLLSKQLNSLRPPPSESHGSSPNNGISEDEPSASGIANGEGMLSPQHSDQIENVTTTPTTNSITQRTACESPLNGYNSHMSISDAESNPFPRSPLNGRPQKQRSRSSSSSSTSNTIPEKHGRGFSRFFSKGVKIEDTH